MAIEHRLLLTRTQLPTLPPPTDLVYAAAREETEPSATWHAEDYGIRNATNIYFRLNKFKLEEAVPAFLSLVREVLLQADDDALLLGHCELPVLRRSRGRLVLSSRAPWLEPEEFARAGFLAEIEDLGGVP